MNAGIGFPVTASDTVPVIRCSAFSVTVRSLAPPVTSIFAGEAHFA